MTATFGGTLLGALEDLRAQGLRKLMEEGRLEEQLLQAIKPFTDLTGEQFIQCLNDLSDAKNLKRGEGFTTIQHAYAPQHVHYELHLKPNQKFGATVLGDIHAHNLTKSIFDALKNAVEADEKLIFTGDYVGVKFGNYEPHNREALLLPLVLQQLFPEQVFALAGNHDIHTVSNDDGLGSLNQSVGFEKGSSLEEQFFKTTNAKLPLSFKVFDCHNNFLGYFGHSVPFDPTVRLPAAVANTVPNTGGRAKVSDSLTWNREPDSIYVSFGPDGQRPEVAVIGHVIGQSIKQPHMVSKQDKQLFVIHSFANCSSNPDEILLPLFVKINYTAEGKINSYMRIIVSELQRAFNAVANKDPENPLPEDLDKLIGEFNKSTLVAEQDHCFKRIQGVICEELKKAKPRVLPPAPAPVRVPNAPGAKVSLPTTRPLTRGQKSGGEKEHSKVLRRSHSAPPSHSRLSFRPSPPLPPSQKSCSDLRCQSLCRNARAAIVQAQILLGELDLEDAKHLAP